MKLLPTQGLKSPIEDVVHDKKVRSCIKGKNASIGHCLTYLFEKRGRIYQNIILIESLGVLKCFF